MGARGGGGLWGCCGGCLAGAPCPRHALLPRASRGEPGGWAGWVVGLLPPAGLSAVEHASPPSALRVPHRSPVKRHPLLGTTIKHTCPPLSCSPAAPPSPAAPLPTHRTDKIGNKTLKYPGEGGWVLLHCVLDVHMANLLKGNVSVM